MDFSNMSISDWIIRAAIFGVLACAVIGMLQNIFSAIKKVGGKNQSPIILLKPSETRCDSSEDLFLIQNFTITRPQRWPC